MKVAKVWVNKFESGKLLGFADIVFSLRDDGDGILTIRGFKIFRNDDGSGIQVALPSRKDDKGEYRPLVSVDKENQDAVAFMNHVTEKVAIAFANADKQKKADAPASSSSQIQGNPDPSGIPF